MTDISYHKFGSLPQKQCKFVSCDKACSRQLYWKVMRPSMMLTPVTVFVLALWVWVTLAQARTCSSAEAQRAEMQAVTLRSWDALYKSFKQYHHCDDGAIAEGYSESVARILVDHWDSLPRLGVLSKRDTSFGTFVVRHIDATLNMEDVEKIKENATHRCPKRQNALCSRLSAAANEP